MSLSMAVFTFINAWFVSLFFVLPFYAKPPQQPDAASYAAAPETPRWKRVVLVNSAVALGFTLVLWAVVGSGLLPMREWAGGN